MTDSTAKTIFKIVGVLHILFGLFMLCTFALGLAAAGLLAVGESELKAVGETSGAHLSTGLVIFGSFVSIVSAVLYAFSAFGFLKLKKWQPTLFAVIIVFTVLEMIYNLIANGLQLGTIISVLFLFIWGGLLYLVWNKKALFTN